MGALRIELPEPLQRFLAEKARRERRSLAQQAVIELSRLADLDAASHRREAIAALRAALEAGEGRATSLDPVDAVREDRER